MILSAPTSEEKPKRKPNRSIAARWTARLAMPYCPVSTYFLENYWRLGERKGKRGAKKGLSSTEAMLILHLMSYKWDERAPFPALETLATRLNISPRAVLYAIERLEKFGYLKRVQHRTRGPNHYMLDGLFAALEQLMDEDEALDREQKAARIRAQIQELSRELADLEDAPGS